MGGIQLTKNPVHHKLVQAHPEEWAHDKIAMPRNGRIADLPTLHDERLRITFIM